VTVAAVEAPATRTPPGVRAALRCIPAPVAAVAAINLVNYLLGRLGGAIFTYTQDGATIDVDALSVLIMSTIPLATGLVVVAALATRWRPVLDVAKIAAPTLAVVTIGAMTIPAGFDRTSTILLAAMHLVIIPGALRALATMSPPVVS
jgi:hypothetical protein